ATRQPPVDVAHETGEPSVDVAHETGEPSVDVAHETGEPPAEAAHETGQPPFAEPDTTGRKPNGIFPFHPEHPLSKTHQQRLRSKYPTLGFAGKPPPSLPSTAEGMSRNPAWWAGANIFAAFWMTLCIPWASPSPGDEGRMGPPGGPLVWDAFCTWVQRVDEKGSPPERAAVEHIRRVYSMGSSRSSRMLTNSYRFRSARRFGEDGSSVGALLRYGSLEHDDDQCHKSDSCGVMIEEIMSMFQSEVGGPAGTISVGRQASLDYTSSTVASLSLFSAPAGHAGTQGQAEAQTAPMTLTALKDLKSGFKKLREGSEDIADIDADPSEVPPLEDTDEGAPGTLEPPRSSDMALLGHQERERERILSAAIEFFVSPAFDSTSPKQGLTTQQQEIFLGVLGAIRSAAARRKNPTYEHPTHQILQVIHGGPGAGKSFVIKSVTDRLTSGLLDGDPLIAGRLSFVRVVAPTGIAAAPLGGSTIHGFFGLSLADFSSSTPLPPLDAAKLAIKANDWGNSDVLIIDEMSMNSAVVKCVARSMHQHRSSCSVDSMS
ncbi:hypothetical protein B484DRAFT_408862, partial [Ochromonadaceae sp. CCMP2298]